VSPRKTEAKDLRSLDGPGLRAIFRPLDPNEKPSPRQPGRNLSIFMFTFPFTRDEPTWKDAFGLLLFLLLFPMLLALISVDLWLGVPQLVAWLSVLGFVVAYTAGAVLINRKP
jgi:hypothetical protein